MPVVLARFFGIAFGRYYSPLPLVFQKSNNSLLSVITLIRDYGI